MLFWRTKLYNGILNIHWKWLNMKYNNMINSCHIRVVLLFLFSKFPIARLHNFYNKNCKLRKNLRLQNIVDFSKIFKQIRQEKGTFNQDEDAGWRGLGEELWAAALPFTSSGVAPGHGNQQEPSPVPPGFPPGWGGQRCNCCTLINPVCLGKLKALLEPTLNSVWWWGTWGSHTKTKMTD